MLGQGEINSRDIFPALGPRHTFAPFALVDTWTRCRQKARKCGGEIASYCKGIFIKIQKLSILLFSAITAQQLGYLNQHHQIRTVVIN